MNAPIATLYFISVGVLLMAAFHAALLARSSAYTRAYWTFATICLSFSLFQFFCAMQYVATDYQAALSAHKWVNVFSILIVALIGYLVASLENKPSSLMAAYCVAGLAALVIVANFLNPFGYRFDSLQQDGLIALPWGEQINILSGEPSVVYRLMRLVSLAVLIYTIVFAIRIRKLGGRLANRLIWISILLMLITASFAGLSDSGVLKMPYLAGFGFLFLVAGFSVLVRADVSNRKIEEIRINEALEREVKSHKIANQRFEHALHNDPLTGLPNRAGALMRLNNLIDINKLNQTKLAVFLFDIDQLGIINGTRGHKAGDQLLREVSQRLQSNLRDSDLIARLDSGGFVIGASGLKGDGCETLLHEKLSSALEHPFDVAGSILKMTFSAGVAVFPDDSGMAEDILAAAELALHDAKSSGPGNLRCFHPSLKENIQSRIDFESALKEALEKKQFFLCYQPQVLASDGRTVCLEALIRWQHPTYGLVMPDRFIQLAESMGLIASIGAWVIDSACEQLARWRAMGFEEIRVAVNLSAQQLLDPDLEETVTRALERYMLAGSDLELEITESVLMQDPERSIERLSALRKLGVRLSIDDFGTGYSSLGYLRVLPVHAFKLDRSFVRDIGNGGKDLEICATSIGLANNLGLEIVAEGVETEAQMQQLRTLGCHLLQGYFFAKPLIVDAASHFLTSCSHTVLMSQEEKQMTLGLAR